MRTAGPPMVIHWSSIRGARCCWTWGQSPASPCARSTWRGLRMYAAAFRPSATADGFRLRCKTDDRFRYPLFVCACFRGMVRFDRRSEEHTSELQSLMRISYAVFCFKKKTTNDTELQSTYINDIKK